MSAATEVVSDSPRCLSLLSITPVPLGDERLDMMVSGEEARSSRLLHSRRYADERRERESLSRKIKYGTLTRDLRRVSYFLATHVVLCS